MADWPSTLPQRMTVDGYGSSMPNLTVKTALEGGPAKIRRRTTCGVRPIKGTIIFTHDELADFKTFFEDTILGGSLRFNWIDPEIVDEDISVEMRFTDIPSWTPFGNDWKVSLGLEILP